MRFQAKKHASCSENESKKRSAPRRKVWLLAICLALAAPVGVGSTAAYLTAHSGSTVNTFSYASVACTVTETFDGMQMQDVKVQNTGRMPTYIRSAIVVTWTDPAGNTHWQAPQPGVDYTITLADGWVRGTDGYYYWATPVAPLESTGVLLTACTEMAGRAPAGYTLSVEILADAVQSTPPLAAEEAWGVTVMEGQVSVT